MAGLTTGHPFEAFDSAAEINRLFMVGPIRLRNVWGPPAWNVPVDPLGGAYSPPEQIVPLTLLLARTLNPGASPDGVGLTGDLPDFSQGPAARAMAGRIDFASAQADNASWTWRLLSYFTTQSPLYDGVDNDGSGAADLADLVAAAADPAHRIPEGVSTLNRAAGRININTAPPSVLRAVPYMSLLPTSAEYTHYAGGPVTNPAGVFTQPANTGLFWDFASAIVAQRENRSVQLRLPNASGVLQLVATAGRTPAGPGGGSTGPGGGSGAPAETSRPFASVGSLATLTDLVDTFSGVYNDAFAVDRFWSRWQTLPLSEHLLGGSVEEWSSPDFRYRADGTGSGLIDYLALDSTPFGNGGLRARDVFLARWSSLLTTRSDVFTAYIVLLDENGNYVQRSQVTLDRSVCFGERPTNTRDPDYWLRRPILPSVLLRQDGSYLDDTK